MESNSVTPDLPATQQSSDALAYPQGVPMSMPLGEDSDGGEGISVSGLLHSLRRQLLPGIGLGILIATLMAGVLWFLIPLEYRAESVLRVSRELSEGTAGDYMIYKETQGALLKSNFVVTGALRDNDVNQLSMVTEDRFGRVRKPGEAVVWLTDSLSVNFAGDSELIFASLNGRDRDETKALLKAVVDHYREEIVMKERVQKTQTRDRHRLRYNKLFEEIKRKSDELSKLAKQLGHTDNRVIAQEQAMRMSQLNAVQRLADRLTIQYQEALDQYRLMALQLRLGNGEPSEYQIMDELEKDPQYYALRIEIDQLKDEITRISGFVKPNSGQLVQLQQEVALRETKRAQLRQELEPRVVARIKNMMGQLSPTDQRKQLMMQQQQVRNLLDRLRRVEADYDEKLVEVEKYGGSSGDLEARTDDLTALRRELHTVRSDLHELEVELESPARIQVIQESNVANKNNLRAKIFQIAGGWIVSLCGVVALVSYWDFLGRRVNGSRDLAHSLRVVGSLPAVHQTGLLTFGKPGRAEVEKGMKVAIDALRTTILYNRQHPAQTVMVTSATGQEGRSTVASQLAVSMARAGKTTLLIDADLRNPQQHQVFGIELHGGLSEMLRGDQTSDQAIAATDVENVWLLGAGRVDQAALQGLSGDQANAVFQEFRERFDMIIIDASPVLTGADSLLVGQHADAAVVSVRRDVSQMPKVSAATDRLVSVGIPVLGAVVNGDGIELRAGEVPLAAAEASDQPALTNA